MIKGIIAPGYNISDNCHKYTNDDSTIECYVYTREALLKPIISAHARTDAGVLERRQAEWT